MINDPVTTEIRYKIDRYYKKYVEVIKESASIKVRKVSF